MFKVQAILVYWMNLYTFWKVEQLMLKMIPIMIFQTDQKNPVAYTSTVCEL